VTEQVDCLAGVDLDTRNLAGYQGLFKSKRNSKLARIDPCKNNDDPYAVLRDEVAKAPPPQAHLVWKEFRCWQLDLKKCISRFKLI
jgi:hypothetical protein